MDLADKAANSYTKEFLFGQTHNERSLLQLVDDALARIRENSFGECVSCHRNCSRNDWKPCLGPATALSARKRKRTGSSNYFLQLLLVWQTGNSGYFP